jgi:hypothetical protein
MYQGLPGDPAVRHGWCAETFVEIVEDIDDYKGFEAAIIADYDARTAVERELVLRLASLLWRLRRTTTIETDLLRIQAEILRDRRFGRFPERLTNVPSPIFGVAACIIKQKERRGTTTARRSRTVGTTLMLRIKPRNQSAPHDN